jgi:hypothetical protein
VSAFAYGKVIGNRGPLSQQAVAEADQATGQQENKLITALAGIVPVEVIAGHGLVLAATTTTKDDVTTISSPIPLQWSLPILAAVAMILFLLGRGVGNWKPVDFVRLAIPPIAFLIWTALIGTSALSPWIRDLDHAWVTVGAAAAGAVVVVVSGLVAPPKES